ncbi:MAG: RNA-binding S4 domain-containing protein [Acidobacteriota bacterium]
MAVGGARFSRPGRCRRTLASWGRIESNGQASKPAREVKIGDVLRIKNPAGEFQVEVLGLSEMRGPAPVAQALYRETEASKELRLKLAEERKAMPQFDWDHEGRPSKKDRRVLSRLRGR